jgi:hypothetical protein
LLIAPASLCFLPWLQSIPNYRVGRVKSDRLLADRALPLNEDADPRSGGEPIHRRAAHSRHVVVAVRNQRSGKGLMVLFDSFNIVHATIVTRGRH